MKNYKGYLIDLDGTMYLGTDEIDGAAQFIDYLNNHQIPHLYVTNNSTKTPEEVTQKLKEMNIKKLKVVCSKEIPIKTGDRTPGSISFVPPVCGMVLASYVVSDILKSWNDSEKNI